MITARCLTGTSLIRYVTAYTKSTSAWSGS